MLSREVTTGHHTRSPWSSRGDVGHQSHFVSFQEALTLCRCPGREVCTSMAWDAVWAFPRALRGQRVIAEYLGTSNSPLGTLLWKLLDPGLWAQVKDLEEAQAMVLRSRGFPGNFLPKCICSSVKALDNNDAMTGRVTLVVGTPRVPSHGRIFEQLLMPGQWIWSCPLQSS